MSAQLKLFQAARENNIVHLKKSLEEGALLRIRNEGGEDALIIAVKHNSFEACEYILKQGATTDTQDQELRTALHWAVINRNAAIVRLLMDYQATLSLVDSRGKTPVELARINQLNDIVSLLTNVSASTYHADLLALRENINLIANEEDCISKLLFDLPSLVSKIDSNEICNLIDKIRNQLLQPEELLNWETLSKSKKNALIVSGLDEERTKIILSINLSLDHNLFSKINKLISDIDNLQQKITQKSIEPYPTLSGSLRKIKQYYLKFSHDLSQAKGENRLELCQGKLRIRGFFGFRYINNGVALRFRPYLVNEEESSKIKPLQSAKKDNEFGSHACLQMFDTFYKLHPFAPGIEHAVDSLNKVISGQGSTATELLVINKGPLTMAMIASKAVRGEVFVNILDKQAERIKNLDVFNYTAHVVLSLLVCPSDAKPDNYIAVSNSTRPNALLRIIGIDNDLAFGDPIVLLNKQSQIHLTELKSIFFCLPQMDQPIDKIFRQAFLKQPPILLMLKWLNSLLLQEQNYLSYQQDVGGTANNNISGTINIKKVMREQEFKNLHLPIKFLPGTLERIFTNLNQIHHLMTTQPQITHQQLLDAVYPTLGYYYNKIRSESANYLERIANVYRGNKLEDIFRDQPQLLVQLGFYKRTSQDIEEQTSVTLADSCTNFISTLNFKELGDIHLQSYVLDKIEKDFYFVSELTLYGCEALNDERLESLAHSLSNLKSLTLVNCNQLTGSGLTALLCHHPHLKLTLDGFSQLSSLHLLHILQHGSEVNLIIEGKKYHVKQQLDIVLGIAFSKGYGNLITALLLQGAHLNKDRADQSPLHLVCEEGNLNVVKELLTYGAPVNNYNQYKETPLDVAIKRYGESKNQAIQQNFQEIIIALLSKGAVLCREPQLILDIGMRSSLKNSHQEQLYKFACCHNLLNEHNISQLVSPHATVLLLPPPSQFRGPNFTLTVSLIRAIANHMKYLAELTIVGSAGFSPEILQEIKKIKSLLSLNIDYDQACASKLVSLDTLQDAHQLQQGQLRIYLSSLRLIKKVLTKDHLLKLGTLLRKSTHLKILELCDCQIDIDKLKNFVGNLQNNQSLEILLFNKNPLSIEGGNILLEAMLSLGNLQELSLDSTQLSAENGVMIGRLISQSQTLSKLSLCNNKLSDDGVVAIANKLQEDYQQAKRRGKKFNFESLVQLSLNNIDMEDAGAIAMGRALLSYKNLEELDIGYNEKLTNKGAEAFIELQQVNPRLKYLKAFGYEEQLSKKTIENIVALNRRNQSLYQKDALQRYEEESQQILSHGYVQTVLPSGYLAIKALEHHNNYLRILAEKRLQRVQSNNSPQNQNELRAQEQLVDQYGRVNISLAISFADITYGTSIGKGAFGTVYKGEFKYAPVAIKQLNKDSIEENSIREILLETSVMAPLRSPYIVELYGVCLESPNFAIVMEYVPKGPLSKFIHSQNPVSWDIRYQIGLDVACGMAYLHSCKIIHADLKSPNVLLNNENRAKLADFGISKVKKVHPELLTDDINQGTVLLGNEKSVGSLPWMAPELFSDNPQNTAASDVYSFGSVLWELSARKPPHQNKSPYAIIGAFMNGQDIQEEIPKDSPPSYARLIRFCWEKNPEQRPTMRDAVKTLREEFAQINKQNRP